MVKYKERHLRHELKYYINCLQYQILRRNLAKVLTLDPNAGPDGLYHIRSLYFDDFKNTALNDKTSGYRYRTKYRIRIYNYSDDFIKFERKSKLDQYVCKESVRLTRAQADRLIAGDISFLANSESHFLKTFYLESRSKLLRPVALVDYHREAYVHPVGNVRITFDIDLHTNLGSVALFDPTVFTMGVNKEQGIILEVKFDNVLPQHIRGLFPDTIRPREAIGKFAICRITNETLLAFR